MAYVARTIERVAADTDVTTVSTTLFSVAIRTDGTNAASVIIKDGTAAAGTAVLELNMPGAGPSAVWQGAALLASGLGVDVTGTGAVVSVEFDEN